MTNTKLTQHRQQLEALYQQGLYRQILKRAPFAVLSQSKELWVAPFCELLLARCYHSLWSEQAEARYLLARDLAVKALGEQHAFVADALDGLGKLCLDQGDPQRAAPLLEESHTLRQIIFGAEHPDTAESLLHLAELYTALSQHSAALPFYQESLRIFRLVSDERKVATALNCLGFSLWKQRRLSEASTALHEARQLRELLLPPTHPELASTLWNIALVSRDSGDLNEAVKLLESASSIFEGSLGLQHPRSYCSLLDLGELYRLMGRRLEALQLYQKASKIQEIKEEAQRLAKPLSLEKRKLHCAWQPQQKKSQGSTLTQRATSLSLSEDFIVVSDAQGVYSFLVDGLSSSQMIFTQIANEAFFFSGGELLVVSADRLVHLWQRGPQNMMRYSSFLGSLPRGPLVAIPERRQLLCVEGRRLSLYSIDDLREVASVELPLDGSELLPPAVSIEQDLIAIGALSGETVMLYQLDTLDEVDSISVEGSLRAISSNKTTLYAATDQWIFAYQRGQEDDARSFAWAAPDAKLSLIAASPDDRLLAISIEQEIGIYDTKTHTELSRLRLGVVEQLFFHKTQPTLFVLTQTGKAHAFSLA